MKRMTFTAALAILLILCAFCSGCADLEQYDPSPNGPADPDYLPDDGSVPMASVTIQNTPIIYIETENGSKIPENKSEVPCTVRLVSKYASECAEELIATIRCRGNGSMTVGKETGKYPYKLKFDDRINVFNLGAEPEKDWVLLANVGEHTMLRNYAAKYMGNLLDGIPYCSRSKLVNVYLNGDYIGVYELTEQVEVKPGRVNIDDTCKGVENGFLVELDAYARREDDEEAIFTINDTYYTIQSKVRTDKQMAYIRQYIAAFDDAIYADDPQRLAELVDMDSLVDMYILQEFAKNIDVGFSSFYMYKDVEGKMFFAPPWDFDLAFGNDERLDDGSYEGLYVATGREDFKQNSDWYIQLYSYDWFRVMVADRWKQVSETLIPQVIEEVRCMADEISSDMEYNYSKWPFLGKRQHLEPEAIANLTTYEEHVAYLLDWMVNRQKWLDGEFAQYQTVNVNGMTA